LTILASCMHGLTRRAKPVAGERTAARVAGLKQGDFSYG